MKKDRTAKPEPVPVNVVCSLCGEAWASHRATDGEVTTLECIRLLRAKASRPTYVPYRPVPVYPYTQPGWWQTYPLVTYSQTTTTGGQIDNHGTTPYTTINSSATQPKVMNATPA